MDFEKSSSLYHCFFRRHVCLSNLKHAPPRELPLTARKTVFSQLNEGKTKAMLITGKRLSSKINEEMTLTIKGTELELVPSAKLLGLEIDSELSFTSLVEKICKKLSQRIGVLKKIRSCLPTKQRLLYYNTMIRSVSNIVV